ncbi:DEAD/DEAH box helicase [Candidatus Woesearchaeota archaeon]|nr:DEAD/DEAH box helicase [Candidatus Woesearchaeota archaeon]
MKYKEFTLDPFQEDAIHSIEKNHSVVVSAATGTGKTLIADYIIDKSIKEKKRVIYTAPIKALSNQKYRDFIHEYGKDKIGILTGDVVINDRAPVLIMTTEVYRNMLLEHSIVPDLSYVIFDEVHFMNDPERGTVWEESIIFSPKTVRFLCLSATIPNAAVFSQWIRDIKGHEVDVVTCDKRAVPLQHFLFDNEAGVTTARELKRMAEMEENYRMLQARKRKVKKRSLRPKPNPPNHLYLVEYLQENDMLPTIFFTFSRKQCWENGLECAKEFDFTSDQEKAEIIEEYNAIIPAKFRSMRSMQNLRSMLVRGIATHNAGILPMAKELVEILFSRGLISVLYATETFAVGINMPARSVCLQSLRKFDGRTFRYLYSKEYYQIAGRAGRRGIDKQGFVFAMVDKGYDDIPKIISITTKDVEPIVSQFSLSPNMVLNLVDNYDDYKIEEILKQNFGYYMLRKKRKRQVRIMASFNNLKRKLTKNDYIDKRTNRLTAKGRFAARLYADELLLGELLFNGTFNRLSETDINVLLGAIVYEPRRADKFYTKIKHPKVKVDMSNKLIRKRLKEKHLALVDDLVRSWSEGCEFKKLLSKSNLAEGDIIRFFRQIIDRLGQIMKAESSLTDKLKNSAKKIDRDVVAVEFY